MLNLSEGCHSVIFAKAGYTEFGALQLAWHILVAMLLPVEELGLGKIKIS